MADPKVKFKRSSVQGKSPAINDLPLGEIALNTYDGIVYVAKSTDSGLTTSIINISGIKIEDDDNLVGYANTINFKGTGVVATIQNGVGIVTVTSGGEGSTPGGVSGNIQFNDNGSFEGSNNLTFNGNDVYVAGVVTATSFSGTATSTTNIPNLTGDVTSNNTATTLATVNSNIGTFGSSTAIPSITVNAKGLVTGVTTNAITVGDGTLTLATSGTGLSGSASFTANQSGNSTFTVTSNATSNNDTSTIVARDSSGNFSAGTITASLNGNASSATYASTAGVATALQNPRTFQITGDIIASPVSFDGSGNVSLAATVQPNSVGLGTDTFGDYVQSLSGTTNQITVTSGTGEGSTPTLSIPNQFTVPQDIEVTRDLQVNRNLNVIGNITIGGTSASLFSQSLNIFDPDIVLGFRTDAFGNDISNDNTANHGGVALASTEGTPLVQLFIAGIETNPATYKKIMWFKAGEFAGLGTDAWLINYAVGIGSTQFPTGTRLAAGSVQFTEDDLTVVRNINASGIITATGGFNLGISSAGTPITSGPLTTLNFVGAGNTFAINGTTVDISVAGGGGGASVSISTEAPSDPNEGDLWYSSLLGRTFIYYGDDDGSQWVDASPFNIPEPDSTPAKTSGTFTATEGQTVFNYTYNPGFIDVFLNGIRLNSSEFTTNNGTSITLITPASLNDVLDVVEYTMGIGDTGPQGPQGAGGPLQNITQTTTNETLYPIIATGTGSTLPFITTTNDYFEFNPSSGTLITNQLKVVGVVTASTFFGDGENLTNITASYASSSGIATYATSSGIATYAATSGVSTVSQGLTGTPNITVGVVTSSSIKVENIDVSNKTVGISSTSSPTDTSANNSGIVIYGNTNKSLTYNNTKKSFEFNIPLATNETRVLSVAEKSIVVNGNTVNLSYTQSNSNIAICTNPSGNITLNVTDIPTTSDFDNHSLTFSVIVTSTGTARTCTAINLNGVSRTIKWIGGSLANALVGVTTTNGYIVQSFSGINTVGSASTTSNYEIFGSVSGAFI